MSICAATIFKSEHHSLLEWIDYHTLVGIDHFYICQDVCSDIEMAMTQRLLREHIISGLVTLYDARTLFPNTIGQSVDKRRRPFYDLVLTQLKVLQDLNKYDWMTCLGVNDFLVPKVHGTLPRLLESFDPNEITGVAFNCVQFGCGNSSDIPIYTPNSLIASSQSVLSNEATIASIGSIKHSIYWHVQHPVGDKPLVTPKGETTSYENITVSYDVAFFAHYIQPSLELLNAKWRDGDYPYPGEAERRRSLRDIAMNRFTNNEWVNYPKKDKFDPNVKSTEVFDLYNLRKAGLLPEIPETPPAAEQQQQEQGQTEPAVEQSSAEPQEQGQQASAEPVQSAPEPSSEPSEPVEQSSAEPVQEEINA
jgi:hypothetical protein